MGSGRDVRISAAGGGLAAGVVHGDVVLAARERVAGMAVRLPPRPGPLAGREELLAELDGRLAPAGRAGPRVGVLCGLGGAGKTSVAVEYAYRCLAEAETCWLLQAEDPGVLAAEFAVLAAQLGAREAGDGRDPVAAVHGVLARAQGGWLLVFDNVPDQAGIERFLPPAGDGRVVVTTQSQHWPAGQALDVPVLEVEVAAAFLVSRAGSGGDLGAARELAGELGGLPLALEQAAAYMQATGMPLGWYLPLFRARQADLLARGEVAGHRQHTAATLGLALARLGSDAPAAAGLLRLLAFLAPEPAPLGLLLAGVGARQQLPAGPDAGIGPLLGDPVAAGDAVAALRRYSLAALAGDGQVQVHRLVQAVTRAQLAPEQAGQWRQAAAAVVAAAVPANPSMMTAWPACSALLPHAQAALDPASDGMFQIAWSIGHSGSYQAARDLFVRIADARRDSQDYGPGHPETLSALSSHAWSAGAAGEKAAARDQFAALLPEWERVSGPGHPHTLDTRAALARWTGEAGDAAAARDQFAALLPACERILGASHPSTLEARASHARWTGEAGDAAAARHQFAALLPEWERASGPGHPDTVEARAALARWTGEAGDAASARDQCAALVGDRVRLCGPDHPSTLGARADLARWTGEAGEAAAARDQYAAVLGDWERLFGPERAGTLQARAGLARWTRKEGC
ncbi:MAG TPA: tetratricopeptide repeat protein [Streptosporangiaceae bacterium]